MIFALIGAVFIGISLGLLGSGGSILTVPVLVYLLGQDPKVAMAGSLLIVGFISVFALVGYARKKLVDWRTVWWFGLPGMLGAVLGAWLAHFLTGAVQMIIFSVLVLIAAYLMLRPVDLSAPPKAQRKTYKIVLDGLLVGAVTGLVGVGGGFLIIPALVILGGLSMRLAVGTSLVIIVLKSFAGFVAYLDVLQAQNLALDWTVLWIFIALGILGSYLGQKVSDRLNQQKLKIIFGWFMILIGSFILLQSMFF